jgi:four helix bundle protein
MAGHFKQLTVWRKSIDFANLVYNETDNFPKHEQFELRSQMRRAAVSVPSNIAEGQAHRSHKDFIRFLRISRGSIAELQTQAVIAGRRGYLSREQVRRIWRAADEINKMVNGLITATEKQLNAATGAG